MQLHRLITDERAVPPVIGVILMVAITVILAAIIGTFVLGLGDQIRTEAPQASFTFDFEGSGSTLVVTHDGGDVIDVSGGASLEIRGGTLTGGTAFTGTVGAGDSITATGWTSDTTYRVVWTSANGDTSATLGKATAP